MTRWPSKRAEKSRRGAASWPFTNVNEPAAAALAALGSLWANVKACAFHSTRTEVIAKRFELSGCEKSVSYLCPVAAPLKGVGAHSKRHQLTRSSSGPRMESTCLVDYHYNRKTTRSAEQGPHQPPGRPPPDPDTALYSYSISPRLLVYFAAVSRWPINEIRPAGGEAGAATGPPGLRRVSRNKTTEAQDRCFDT
ncbi:hypothetical protein GEV33_006104 [Tenebrio molitor]|uniref:Uncharacterized protein n=1 Tax=Tenebrio molitor TaxID=7067 RepID=A0A8J6HLV6_TENMO|nr:hypothetical protein GEV33_006104 [Tenebrio molitor]